MRNIENVVLWLIALCVTTDILQIIAEVMIVGVSLI